MKSEGSSYITVIFELEMYSKVSYIAAKKLTFNFPIGECFGLDTEV